MITLDVMTRNKTVMVRLSDEEHQRLSVVASGQGATLAGYLRAAAHQQLVRCPQTLWRVHHLRLGACFAGMRNHCGFVV